MTIPSSTLGATIESVLIKGDLAKLTEQERVTYYLKVCESLGLNPMTRPFDYITLNGKLQLYAKKDATDQLRKLYGISLKLMSQDVVEQVFTVHARAHDKDGREDEDLGTTSFVYPERFKDRTGNWREHPKAGKPLEGEDRANAVLKTVTKAKRRVTLSICGLGFFDETDIDDMVPAVRGPPRAQPSALLDAPDDPSQALPGNATEGPAPADSHPAPPAGAEAPDETDSERIARLDRELAVASQEGWAALKARWHAIDDDDAVVLAAAMNNRHKPRALEVERSRKEAR